MGHSSIALTLDTYSHVVGGLQEVAAQRFEGVFNKEALTLLTHIELANEDASTCRQNVGSEDGVEREPPGTRTLNRLIKSYCEKKPAQVFC